MRPSHRRHRHPHLRRALPWATLIVAVALVVVPGTAGSRTPASAPILDAALLQPVGVRSLSAGPAAVAAMDTGARSSSVLRLDDPLLDPIGRPAAPSRKVVAPPNAPTGVIRIPIWRLDPEISWYGPGFYGSGTACGQKYSKTIMGVAHRTLPCGTLVSFKHGSRKITVPVIDRGPYVAGRIFDLSRAACEALNHCYTGPIYYRFP